GVLVGAQVRQRRAQPGARGGGLVGRGVRHALQLLGQGGRRPAGAPGGRRLPGRPAGLGRLPRPRGRLRPGLLGAGRAGDPEALTQASSGGSSVRVVMRGKPSGAGETRRRSSQTERMPVAAGAVTSLTTSSPTSSTSSGASPSAAAAAV